MYSLFNIDELSPSNRDARIKIKIDWFITCIIIM